MRPKYLAEFNPDKWADALDAAERIEDELRKRLLRQVRSLTREWNNVLKAERLKADACLNVAVQATAAASATGDLSRVGAITESATLLAHAIVDRAVLERKDYEARFGEKDSGEVVP
jgi:hypothetical protein